MKKITVLLLFLTSLVFAEDNPFIGEWNIEVINWENSRINTGVLRFYEDMHCEVEDKFKTNHNDYSFDETMLFISDFGYYWEITDNKTIKLTPAHESPSKFIFLIKKDTQ